MTLGHERPVGDLLGGGDAVAKDLDGAVGLGLVVRDEHGQDERHLAPEDGVTGVLREALRLGEPAVRLGRSPLPLVDVAEQEQCLAFDVGAVEARSGLGDLYELLTCLLEAAEHHHDVRASEAEVELHAGMLVAKHVERPRVIPLCLVKAFPPFGAAGCVRQRPGRLQQRRLDRAAGYLAGEAARLLQVPGDDLDDSSAFRGGSSPSRRSGRGAPRVGLWGPVRTRRPA